eukprot:CAMPEP_0172638996 /NCGR_PEP_ID=MMETSP1068-20121228/216503_1 /TAXON_ID=35684 /ORGANISM="Pseudopedinella elastica, Strain CCMP716" /LENGTH=195 /DNA_ID=CAMNT_0013452013 /DNA_START=11 /DNA_END=594 /DNA_ORIENTATION=-
MAGKYKVVSDYTQGLSTNTNVQVFVRARPPANVQNTKELEERFGISSRDPKRIQLTRHAKNQKHPDDTRELENAFSFDRVFWCESKQEEIFNAMCKQQVDHCLGGYNSCAFAYGQTGSGKTHTMFGDESGELQGMVPRAVEYLFSLVPRLTLQLKDVKVTVSFAEIYCDKIRDLGRAYASGAREKDFPLDEPLTP